MRIAVIGTGYVGLVVGTCFAETGNRVVCVDVDEGKIETLRTGKVPFYEPGLEELVGRNMEEGRLVFGTDIGNAVRKADVCFIAVGTPPGEDGGADLGNVLAVAKSIGQALNRYTVVVLKSTVPVGTHDQVRNAIAGLSEEPFDVVVNPEFLKEGNAIEDFMKPDRVVVGADSERAGDLMRELYEPFVRTGKPILIMDPLSAAMTKYAANAMLATRISFMNEIARICDVVGADVNEVRKGMATDSRIGFPFLFAGVGYGGSCFPKDVRALQRTAEEKGYSPQIVPAVERVNEAQKELLFHKVVQHFGSDLEDHRFAIWGLAFKPKTDDMREAPSLTVIERLLERGADIAVFDPEAMAEAKRRLGDRVAYAQTAMDAVADADALILVTEWSEFRHVDLEEIAQSLKTPILFDGRNIFDPRRARAVGFTYFGIGVR